MSGVAEVKEMQNLVEEYAGPEGIAHAYTIPQLPLIYLNALPEDTNFKKYVRTKFGDRLANPKSKAGFPSWEEYCNYLWFRFKVRCVTHKFDLPGGRNPVNTLNEIYRSLPPEEAKTWAAGDLVFNGDDERQKGAFIFTGDKIEELESDRAWSDFGTIPKQFKLLEYPPNYWRHYNTPDEQVNKNGFEWLNNCIWFSPQFIDVVFETEHVKQWEDLSYVIFNYAGIHYCIAGFTDVAELNQAQWLRLVVTDIDEPMWGDTLRIDFLDFIGDEYNVREDSVYAVLPA